ncbi:MAG: phage holin family protein [Kofleriaceae bacterium]|nr:phage holin family protein [Kofleriaceae bacterium]
MERTSELVQLGHVEQPGVGELLHRITDDMKALASDEVELARVELSTNMRNAVADVSVIALGAVVGLIGLGLLCTVAVVALAPVISSLALRLLLMSGVYFAISGILVAVFAKKLKRGASNALKLPVQEAKETVAGVKDALTH